jgi:uncharacterized membrane protein (UPF0127 family)
MSGCNPCGGVSERPKVLICPALRWGRLRAEIAKVGNVTRNLITIERESGEVVCGRCFVADTPWTRARGLLGRRRLAENEGLLIRPAGSVHTFFMLFAIDVVFLDADGTVVKVVPGLRPWRLAAARKAKRTLELASGTAARAGLTPGERLLLVPELQLELQAEAA